MMNRMTHSFMTLPAICLVVSSVGCATLKIRVDVYKGELIRTDEAQLAQAVGIAKSVVGTLADISTQLKDRQSRKRKDTSRESLKEVIAVFEGAGGSQPSIAVLWDRYIESRHQSNQWLPGERAPQERDGERSRAEFDRARGALTQRLLEFGATCSGIGRRIGGPAAVKLHLPPGTLRLLKKSESRALMRGIGLEEAGRWIIFLVDDVLDLSERTTIARMMESVTLGYSATIANATDPLSPLHWLVSRSIKNALDEVYWSEINTINVIGSGTTEYVIVKDDVGNWHIKSVTASQDEIINAIFDGAEGMVNILAAQYGLKPASPGDPQTNTSRMITQEYIDRQVKAAEADSASESLRGAQLQFALAISQALQEKDEAKQRELIKRAVALFKGQVDGIQYGDTAPGNVATAESAASDSNGESPGP